MAAGTLISRILGFVRVALVAIILGNGTRQADILTLSQSIPNALYILFAGGALNTVLVPQIVRAIKNDDDGGEAYVNRMMTAFMLIVGVVGVLATLFTPWIMRLYAGQYAVPELATQWHSLIMLSYLTMPQIFFYGAFFLISQVLNARDQFGPMMWAPIANNVVSVLLYVAYLWIWGTGMDHSAGFTSNQIWLLGIGTTLGMVAQTAVLLPYMRKVGFTFKPRFDLKGTGLGHTFSLTKWTLGFVAINQITYMVVTNLSTAATAAGSAGAGASAYDNARLLWILPHSLITVSLTTAMLPAASRLASEGNLRGVAEETIRTARLSLVAIIPSTAIFLALAQPITHFMYGNGSGAADAGYVALALMAFAVGLIPFTLQFICLRTFYAQEDTRTPFFLQILIAGANAGLAVLFAHLIGDPHRRAAALALAMSLSYLIGVIVSWAQLTKRVPLNTRALLMHLLRLTVAVIPGSVGGFYLARWLRDVLAPAADATGWHLALGRLLAEGVALAAGVLVLFLGYFIIGKLLHVREFASLSDVVRRRFSRKRGAAAVDGATAGDATDTALIPRLADDEASLPVIPDEPPGNPELPAEDLAPTLIRPLTEQHEPTESQVAEAGLGKGLSDDPEALLETRIRPVETADPRRAARPDDEDTDMDEDGPMPDDLSSDDLTEPVTIGTRGMLLGTRYRADELLTSEGGLESWRAHDLVLSRDVVLHVLADGDPRTGAVIDAARKGAAATDSRFLRVLDAVESSHEERGVGAYVVSEFTPGRTLTDLIASGPLSALEAAWIVRELADGLSIMHAQGLFHEHLSPDGVLVTNSGAVRLVGFGVDAHESDVPEAWSERESADVKALASLLYATLVARWPGRAAYGLPAAPLVAGEPAPPHAVRAGVSPALDRICSAALTERGAASEARITSASGLAKALGDVLGNADASSDLAHRVRTVGPAPEPIHDDFVDFDDVHEDLHAQTWAEAERRHEAVLNFEDTETEVPPAAGGATRVSRRQGRPVFWVLVALAVGTLVVSLVLSLSGRGHPQAGTDASGNPVVTTSGSESGVASGEPVAIADVVDFDPEADNGNAEENPDQVALAHDGDATTGWSTLEYHNTAAMGGLKPGVGLVIDLGSEVSVNSVDVTFAKAGATVELRVPATTGDTSAPMGSEGDWKVVATQADAPESTTLTPTSPVTTRYVLVYLTSLPQMRTARFAAQINEITVR